MRPLRKSRPAIQTQPIADEPQALAHPCPCCGGRMIIIETFRARLQHHDIAHPQARSGSTRHDDDPNVTTPHGPFRSPLLDQPRRRSIECDPGSAIRASIFFVQHRSSQPKPADRPRQPHRAPHPIRSTAFPPPGAHPRRPNPHSAAAQSHLPPPRFPPLEVFVRRPTVRLEPFVSGRHPKTFTKPEILKASNSCLQCLESGRSRTVSPGVLQRFAEPSKFPRQAL